MFYIKSFVKRSRKISHHIKIFYQKYFYIFQIKYIKKKINLSYIFNNTKPIILDIGFGSGELLINLCKYNQQYNFIGIEVYLRGIIQCLQQVIYHNINNIKFIYHDAFYVLKYMLANESISIIQIYFPDPWNKQKHNKRRLINQYYLNIIFNLIKNNGLLYIVTDSYTYYLKIRLCIQNIHYYNYVVNPSTEYQHMYKINKQKFLFITKFWKKAKTNNCKIYFLEYKKYILIK
ncbi:tRNA (guanosine(46)-N7)-methyltransferase TrmB [Enterobacteriaceae endosymbiont of Macroplea appendiculata]|uniref:tRNA (guanosine(46)-N7)-methyltransferase TrmB n=1 Tax=Enterobacteriaceae endosymbiont of Macroplea appendiculata TaxID=2675790 RepID=UPI001448B08D|nr:tRNA (guanosine(46)-N7)-methyltransferase TrmB [Enterobacteriaceae endosymbiont of Macroplea appendiculata]QJC30891.1 tRNA (guanosine(46)-N7)-methyltransferase TrmB [Enterobacteriaceae endosymbiont of Macroplea appendiculata]